MVLLQNLKPGQRCVISTIEGPPRIIRRVAEFGLRPGVEVQMLRPGPASIIRVNASRLCLRSSHHLKIFVEPLPYELYCQDSSPAKLTRQAVYQENPTKAVSCNPAHRGQ